MAKVRIALTAMALALLVASCGGGGGGGTPPIVPPPNGGGGGSEQLSVGQIAGPNTVQEGQSATFSVSASGVTGMAYSWSVSPTSAGSFTNAASASATFAASEVEADTAATIQVVVSASGQTSQTRTKSITVVNVEVAQAPHIVSVSPRSGLSGQQLTFTASVTGSSPLTYSWNFGGGASPNTSSQSSPGVVLASEGTCSAHLTVTNDVGSDTFDFTLSISSASSNLLPEAVATANPTSGKAPLAVSFNGNASQDSDGTITRYEWDFDGNGSYDFSSYSTGLTEHVYTEQGSYLAILRVTDDDGGTDVGSVQITISPRNVTPVPGKIVYSYPPAWYHPRYPTVWSEGAYDPDGSIVLYEWDFDGDGIYDFLTELADPDPSSYNSVLIDINRVVLRVTDNDGATAITTERQRV